MSAGREHGAAIPGSSPSRPRRTVVLAGLGVVGLVAAATLSRVAWLVGDALRPCTACREGDLPDLGQAVAVIGTAYGLLYAVLVGLAAFGLARTLARPERRWSGLAAVLAASLALVLVQGIEGHLNAPFFLLNAAAWLAVVVLAARRAEIPPSSTGT